MTSHLDIKPLPTEFLPAERENCATIASQHQRIADMIHHGGLARELPGLFLVLNDKRQIVFTNGPLPKPAGQCDPAAWLGFRYGEAVGCEHASENEGGCGTTLFCSVCGAARAIVQSLEGHAAVEECRIRLQEGLEALDLRIWASPQTVGEARYAVIAIQDISHEKRRAALERIFFHDLINTAGGIRGLAEVAREQPEKLRELTGHIHLLANRLIEEINAQKQLAAAERGELAVSPTVISSLAMAKELALMYQNHLVARGKRIEVAPDSEAVSFVTDAVLLSRVLGNMVKNALEASAAGQTVRLHCGRANDGIQFAVHNEAVMPQEVRLQVFNRSFSTKGYDRGLGTYAMRLLTEKYLQGRITFTSAPAQGTTFIAWYPMILPVV